MVALPLVDPGQAAFVSKHVMHALEIFRIAPLNVPDACTFEPASFCQLLQVQRHRITEPEGNIFI
jgi:hypothetical protein